MSDSSAQRHMRCTARRVTRSTSGLQSLAVYNHYRRMSIFRGLPNRGSCHQPTLFGCYLPSVFLIHCIWSLDRSGFGSEASSFPGAFFDCGVVQHVYNVLHCLHTVDEAAPERHRAALVPPDINFPSSSPSVGSLVCPHKPGSPDFRKDSTLSPLVPCLRSLDDKPERWLRANSTRTSSVQPVHEIACLYVRAFACFLDSSARYVASGAS